MKSNKIKALRIGTKFRDVEIVTVENKLETFQELVGGYIENGAPVQLRDHAIVLLLNEEGLLIGLEPNQNLFPFFFVGQAVCVGLSDEGDFVSLSDVQVDYLKGWIAALQNY